jgi:hypothetical protein
MRRTATIVVGVLATLAGLVGTATASNSTAVRPSARVTGAAATAVRPAAPAGCASGALCFWRDNNTSGGSNGPGQLQGRNSNWAAFSHPSCQTGTWNNCASFAYNNGNNCTAVMWDGTGYSFGVEGAVWIDRQVGVDLPSLGFNDVASSNSWISPSHTTTAACPGPNPFG